LPLHAIKQLTECDSQTDRTTENAGLEKGADIFARSCRFSSPAAWSVIFRFCIFSAPKLTVLTGIRAELPLSALNSEITAASSSISGFALNRPR